MNLLASIPALSAAAAPKSLQSCPTLCDPIDGSPSGSPVPGILQAKNTGVGCHFLLQCMKVKSESEVAQPCPTLRDAMDCSPPGSPVLGILQSRVLERAAITFSPALVKPSQFASVLVEGPLPLCIWFLLIWAAHWKEQFLNSLRFRIFNTKYC